MRGRACFLILALSGCAAQTGAPSLAPRAAEAIDPRVPVDPAPLPTQADADLVEQLEALVAQAIAGDEDFRAAAATAERLAASAGAPQSESWVVAQQALSAAVAARAPVTRALGEIDSLAARRVQQLGGVAPADLEAIRSAAARVAEIDAREAALVDRLRDRLSG